ncbi:GTP-binding protein RAD-like isoform X1 [Brienomyrus brachyistius]|uniref:GTP-binding protein RAD-like isoform X1 n=2 Tax=Brienomyrus brachyistius TaxID=42636 RepID=UPI0020B1F54B|nr:GTP-binding protein RAD-like isoform X1 [Brienomyrus brachyistius]
MHIFNCISWKTSTKFAIPIMTLNKGNKLRNTEKKRNTVPFSGYHQSRHKRSLTADSGINSELLGRQAAVLRSDALEPFSSSRPEGHVHKVVLLGEHGVGKSCLAQIFGQVEDGHDCDEAGGMYNRCIVVDEEEATILLYDAEQENSQWQREQCLRMGDAYIIVYSVTDKTSFEKASELRIQLRSARQTDNIPIILVGNKSDLVRSREVSVDEGRACAMVFDCKFIETSASLNHNVQELFEGIVRQIRLRQDSKEQNARRQATCRRHESVSKKAKRFIRQIVARKNKKMAFKQKSKSCHDLSVL